MEVGLQRLRGIRRVYVCRGEQDHRCRHDDDDGDEDDDDDGDDDDGNDDDDGVNQSIFIPRNNPLGFSNQRRQS